ncbi:transposase [Corynebacterium glucuronolyticum]|uniref:transposase n=1 Tax=Corynebacterium glucuronolyticum TaxID=39791 RepID=UPI0035CD0789|nr:transposase [Corynebacterium glucuronolyticum]
MYENDPGVSMNQVSKDVGINRATLRYWIDQFGTGKKTAPVAVEKPDVDPTVEKEIRRLRKENARLREEPALVFVPFTWCCLEFMATDWVKPPHLASGFGGNRS